MAADYKVVEVTRKIVEFHLDTPANLTDFDFVRHTALKSFKVACGENVYDDSIKVREGDDCIVFYYEFDRQAVAT